MPETEVKAEEEAADFGAGPLKISLKGKAVRQLGPLIIGLIILGTLVVGYWGMFLTPQEILKNTKETKDAVQLQAKAIRNIEGYLEKSSRGRYRPTDFGALPVSGTAIN